MAAEIALQNAAIGGAVENRAPSFQLTYACGRFFGVQFGHSPTVQILAATHGVGKVNAPGIAVINIGESGGDSSLRHDRMSLAKQGLRDDRHFDASASSFRGSAQTRAACSDYQDIVLMGHVLGH